MPRKPRGPARRKFQDRNAGARSEDSIARALAILADPLKAWAEMPRAELGGSLSGDSFQMVRQGKFIKDG